MKKFLLITVITLFCLVMTGCSNSKNKNEVITISIIEETVPEYIILSELDDKIYNIQIEVTYKKGNKEVLNLDKNMIFPNDFEKLHTPGVHQVTVSYEYVSTSLTLTVIKRLSNYYNVKVVYPDNTIATDVVVEWKANGKIIAAKNLNENGVAVADLDPGLYDINLRNIPDGYIVFNNLYKMDEDNKDLTITLIPYSLIENGNGSSNNPYVIEDGYCKVSFDTLSIEGLKYYSFVAEESGVYTLESFSNTNCSNGHVDPYLMFILGDGSFDKSGNTNENASNSYDFKYSFEAEAGKEYKFIVFISTAQNLPAETLIKISK